MGNTELVSVCLELYKKNVLVCDMESFREEFQRFSYILKILSMYKNQGKLNQRLLLNHMVITQNVFGSYTASVLVEKCPKKIIEELYTVLEYMGMISDNKVVNTPSGKSHDFSKSTLDNKLIELIEEELCRE